jgi:glycosyltransferase involved in cell wall biosynthesis
MVYNVGIFADKWTACTGFATVCSYLANELTEYSDLRVIYFGRFGRDSGFDKETSISDTKFETVKCEGGVWGRETSVQIINHYKLDKVFVEDDWFSVSGVAHGANFWNKELHFLTPIDSLPIHPSAYTEFSKCKVVYIPNRSYQIVDKHVQEYKNNNIFNKYKADIKTQYLPHGVDSNTFIPIPELKEDKFTFLWIGRDDERKSLGRMIKAYEQIKDRYDVQLLIRTDWNTPNAKKTNYYLEHKGIDVIKESLQNCPHQELVKTYNRGHMLVCTSSAGGFEMQTIEAPSCGVPVLVNDWNFMNEQIINGRNGFRVPCSEYTQESYGRVWGKIDVDRLAKIMEWSVNNQTLCEHMGRWGRNYVQEKYNWKDIGKTLYKCLVNETE